MLKPEPVVITPDEVPVEEVQVVEEPPAYEPPVEETPDDDYPGPDYTQQQWNSVPIYHWEIMKQDGKSEKFEGVFNPWGDFIDNYGTVYEDEKRNGKKYNIRDNLGYEFDPMRGDDANIRSFAFIKTYPVSFEKRVNEYLTESHNLKRYPLLKKNRRNWTYDGSK
jgi:hypothetical protein